jgi:hypothetical protein
MTSIQTKTPISPRPRRYAALAGTLAAAAALAGVAGLVAPPPAAQAAEAAPSGPPPEVKRLDRFLGKWKGTGAFTAEGKTAKVVLSMDCSRAASGFAVQCHFLGKGIPGMSVYDAINILGWDPGAKMVHWYWVTNAGETHDHRGMWTGPDALDLPHDGMVDGKAFKETVAIMFKGDKEVSFKSATTLGGQPGETFEGTMKK